MGYSNGRLPNSALSDSIIGGRLRHDAADSADRMATAYALARGEFLRAVSSADAYRSFAQQEEARRNVGNMAAIPGTSNHGWGLAVDFANGMNSWYSDAQEWFADHGRDFGWVTPGWANPNSRDYQKNEPWHKEYHPELDRRKGAATVSRPRGGSIGYGSRGLLVREYQGLLNANVHEKYRVRVDGHFGLASALATLKFQQSRGLKMDAKIGKRTRAALRGRKPTPKPPVEPLRPGTDAFTRGRVKRVQGAVNARQDGVWGPNTDRRLGALRSASAYGGGRFPFTVELVQRVVGVRDDGVWGPASAEAHTRAVKRIQAVLGLTPDGIYGPKTQAALNALENKARD